MAKAEATLVLKVKNLGGSAVKGFNKLLGKIVITAGDVVNAFKAIARAIPEFARLGSEFTSVKQAFSSLAQSQGQDAKAMLDNMKELSAGTVSDMELMKQANNALLLGLPVDKFGDMLSIARSSAKATGQSMEFMLNSIVVGLGRGSKLMLDNLGIIIKTEDAYKNFAAAAGTTADKLTEAQKKQAFINEALRIGKANADKMGKSTLTLADRMDKLKAGIQNTAAGLSQDMAPAFNVIISAAETFFSSFSKFISSSEGQVFFTNLALFVTNLASGIVLLARNISVGLVGAFQSVAAAATLNFSKAKQIATETLGSISQANEAADAASKARAEQSVKDLAALEQRKLDGFKAKLQQKQEAQDEALENEKLKSDEFFAIKNEEELLREATHAALLGDQALQAKIKKLNQDIKAETNYLKRLELVRKKQEIIEKKSEAIRTAEIGKLQKFKEFINSEEIKSKEQTFNKISSLASSNNKALAAIGKAAAIASIIVSTARGVGQALGAFPPPFSFAMAGLVGVAGAAQIAKVAGVQLAEGGIDSIT